MLKNDDLLPRRIRHNNSFPRLRRNFASPAVSIGISTEASATVVAREKKDFCHLQFEDYIIRVFNETHAILFLFSTYPYFPFALPHLPVNKTCKQSFRINCNTFAVVSSVINLSSLEQQVLLILR